MAEFVCNSCGKCCESLGPHFVIERKLGNRDYYCRNKITGEIFLAHIQPEYSGDFEETVEGSGHGTATSGKGCMFMVKNCEGTGNGCAIYPTRPVVCREFRCYRMLIYDAHGELHGTVIGRNDIRTQDETLAKLWKDRVVPLPCTSKMQITDPVWTGKVLEILAANGYRGDPVE